MRATSRLLFCFVVVVSCLTLLATGAFAAKKDSATEEQLAAPAATGPKASDLQRAKIKSHLDKGDKAQAIKALKEAVTSKDTKDISDWATTELYNLAQAEGEVPAVVSDLEKTAAQSPNDIELQRAVAEGYVRERDWTKVVSIYEELVTKNPADSTLSTRLVDYYILAKQYDKVITKLEPIVNANPNDSYHSDTLLNAYVGAKDSGKAIALFKKRLAQEPNSPGMHARYAQALADFGMAKESAQEWEKAYDLDPSNPYFRMKTGK